VELVKTLQERLEALQKTTSDSTEKQVTTMTEMKDKVSSSVADGLKEIQEKNEQKLEQMRLTVDEKLQKTLDERLTQSFEVVNKQLIEVQKGLTEMQTLAQDVGGLKRALTNVKVRGMLGESQLGALLEQFLTRDQYEENVAVKPRSSERVEFAIRLPGGEDGGPLWLPIDSKLPLDAYQRLQDTYENGEKAAWAQAGKAFESQLYTQAAAISSKYIDVPHTTDFALMYLPFEGLYAEAIRRPGVFQDIQKTHRVTIVGPTTLAAFVYSLQVGFKTLAISKQSSEVWRLLGAIKTEFGKFGDAVSSVQKNLETASSNLSKVSTRARQMEKRLDGVQALPQEEALKLLPVGSEKFGNGEDQA
jgi:DNA recombination protein RmuC